MDTNGLVMRRVEDGRKFIRMLAARDFEVTAACWVRTTEEEAWRLYVASPRVGETKLAEAYRAAYAILQKMEGTSISASEVKLIGDKSAIASAILEIRRRSSDTFVDASIARRLGSPMIEEAYIYGPPETLRQAYTVRYERQGRTNQWLATAEPGEMLRDVRSKGAVAYTSTSARWAEQEPEDESVAIVSVLLELDPRRDEQDLTVDPGVWRILGAQAGQTADELFRSHHPEASVQHINSIR